jgi:hypothetical protein
LQEAPVAVAQLAQLTVLSRTADLAILEAALKKTADVEADARLRFIT